MPQPLKLLLLGCTGVLQGRYLALQAADLQAGKAIVAWLCLCARQQAAEVVTAAMAGLQHLACKSMLQACNLAGRRREELVHMGHLCLDCREARLRFDGTSGQHSQQWLANHTLLSVWTKKRVAVPGSRRLLKHDATLPSSHGQGLCSFKWWAA